MTIEKKLIRKILLFFLIAALAVTTVALSGCSLFNMRSGKIAATFDETHTVYADDDLQGLKPYFTVVFTDNDGNEKQLKSADFTLSGELIEGECEITVKYLALSCVVVITVQTALKDQIFNVRFVADGKEVAVLQYTAANPTIDEPQVPNKVGYNGSWKTYSLNMSNITVEAIYTAKSCTIQFDYNGASESGATSARATYNGKIGRLPTPTWSGHAFLGWYWGETPITEDTLWKADTEDDQQVVAKWLKLDGTDNLTYILNSDGQSYSVVGASSEDVTEIAIPSTYNSLPVTDIKSSAFASCAKLIAIAIPDSIVAIGEGAFSGCEALTCLYLTDIAAWCEIEFANGMSTPLYWTKSIYLNGELATDVVVPNGVTKISKYAFRYCESIQTVDIADTVKQIGEYAFADCINLTQVTLSNGLDTINKYTFYNCKALKTAEIPNGVEAIGDSAFRMCSALQSVIIPNSVTNIGEFAFMSCGCSSIAIGNGVKVIGSNAFDSANMSQITLPAGVTSVGMNAFRRCPNLTKVVVMGTETSFATGAFSECKALTNVTLPAGMKTIASKMFQDCSSLQSISIPSTVTVIWDGAFNSTGLKNITVPSGVTSLKESAFSGCKSLTTASIPSSVTEIRSGLFNGCSALTTVTLTSGLTVVGERMFANCTALTRITIPASVSTVGSNAFSGCTSLTSITISEGVKVIGSYAFNGCSSLKSVSLPNSVTTVQSGAFYACTALTSITFGSGLQSIGSGAFTQCYALSSISYRGTKEQWEQVSGHGDLDKSHFINFI